jgi:hypothetical protein
MARVTANLFIGGGLSDAVFVAPSGTSFPTGLAAPSATFKEFGWLSEDGIEGNPNVDRKEFRAHQAGTIVRRKITQSGRTFTVTALETNKTVLDLYNPATVWVDNTTYVQGTIPEGISTVQMAWIIDSYDTTTGYQDRYMFTGEATPTGSFKLGVEDIKAYQFEIAVYGSIIYLSNNASLITDVV